MFDQAVPIGINLTSPATWFVVAVALIVLALTLSTRRANARPRGGPTGVVIEPLTSGARERYRGEWSAAQALFVDDPRGGCERAQAILTSVLHDRGFALGTPELLDPRYRAGCDILMRADTSTDDLRRAFIDFRGAFDMLLGETAER